MRFGPDAAASRMADERVRPPRRGRGGDARQALNVLEGAVALAEDEEAPRRRRARVSPALAHVEAAAQQRVLAYDRAGDGHYDTVSAFIKSLRGNDPDAALYWLAAMVAAGEDPRFIVRRLIIAASEDVGNADPRALQVAVAAAQALDWVGLPEAQYALAQATIYIATAPKSNRAGQRLLGGGRPTSRARARCPSRTTCETAGDRRMKHHGIGVGYRYPHDYEDADVEQQYLPDELDGAALLPPVRPGLRADDRRADGLPRGRARGGARPGGRRSNPVPGPQVDGMNVGAGRSADARGEPRKVADTEKRDAGG